MRLQIESASSTSIKRRGREEADELARATSADEVAWEAADVLYFALCRAVAEGGPLSRIEAELDRRARGITRRDGSRKGVA